MLSVKMSEEEKMVQDKPMEVDESNPTEEESKEIAEKESTETEAVAEELPTVIDKRCRLFEDVDDEEEGEPAVMDLDEIFKCGDTIEIEAVVEEEETKSDKNELEIGEESETTIVEEVSKESEKEEEIEDAESEKVAAIEEEEEAVEESGEAVIDDDQSSSKCSRELKALLELSKEAKLETNIAHKRKSVDPKKLFNKNNLLEDSGDEQVATERPSSRLSLIGKRKSVTPKAAANPKKPRNEVEVDLELIKEGKDAFCWRCHKNVIMSQQSSIGGIYCDTCPRSYHLKCVKQAGNPPWQCPECIKVLTAENIKTRSPSLKSMDLNHLCSLLKFALNRMIQVVGSGPFLHPVNEKEFPDYKKYIIHPMDLTMIQNNIENNVYGSTNAFEADTKWILHNSIIYNSYQSKLTSTAKYIEKICKQEMIEIENCSNCYLNANTKEHWFVEVCPKPHLLIWAKLKGFPYWPAKTMSINRFGMVDVRFFGAHDRAWVSHKDCYLYSQKNPNMHQMKKYNINECIQEVEVYIENLRKKFGIFRYAPFKEPFDPEVDHLPMFLPKYVSPHNKKLVKRIRSESKSSISSVRSHSSLAKDLSKEMESDEENNRMDDLTQENPSTEQEGETKPENDEKPDLEEKNYDLKMPELTEEEKPVKKQDVKITDKLLHKLEKTEEEETRVEKKEEAVNTHKPDYEENDLLEVLYSEEIDGPKSDSAKKNNNKARVNGVTKENALITGIKDNINKALAISKNIQQNMSTAENTKKSAAVEEKKGNELKMYGSKQTAKSGQEKVANSDISKDAVARGFAKIKSMNEINKAINVIRPDLLLKSKKVAAEKKKVIAARRNTNKSEKSEDDLEIMDWYVDDPSKTNGEASKKRKQTFQSNDGNAKKQVQDEVIIIKCESSGEGDVSKKASGIIKRVKTDETPTENLEKRSELFQALNISEKGLEPEKPKVNEIRTRSKTEEKFSNAGLNIKQRARKSFPNTKSPIVYKGKKELPVPPLISTSRVLKQITSPPGLVSNSPIVVSSGTTPTTQSLVLVPTPLLFQGAQIGGANSGQILAMVASGNTPYTFVSQGSTFINGNINLALGKDKIQNNSLPLAIDGKESGVAILSRDNTLENVNSNNAENVDKVPFVEVSELHETGVVNKSTGMEKVSLSIDNPPLLKGKLVDRQQFNSSVSEPLNPTEFNILNGIVKDSVPKTFSEILSRPPPTLKPRPPGPLSTQFDTGVPSSAGPWTARINSISHRLSDYLRGMLIETLNDVSSTTENPEALITTLQLEIESLKSKHAEEILEIKKNVNSLLQDIQKSIVEEKERLIVETRSSCEADTIRRVEEAKSKQWCANCMKEAQFYCCWNTSYCDYPCQTKHWPKHMSKCTQNSQTQSSPQMGIMKGSQQIVLRPVIPPKGFTAGKPLLGKPAKIIMSKTPSSVPMNIVRTSSASGIALVESRSGNYEVITNGQIVDGSKIITTPIKGIRKVPASTTAASTSSSSVTQTTSKTVILQSTKSPVMSPSATKSSEKQSSTDDPLAI